MNRLVVLLTSGFLLLVLSLPVLAQGYEGDYVDEFVEPVMARAQIIELMHETECPYGFVTQVFSARILQGEFRGERVLVENTFSGNHIMDMHLNPGDRVILALEVIDDEIMFAYPQDLYREPQIYLLLGIFVAALLVIGRFKGLRAVLTLGLTVFLIARVMLPAMLRGHDPLLLAIATSVIVTTLTFVVIGGLTRKTMAAIIGTTGGVLIAASISIWVGHLARLTGLTGQEAHMLMYVADEVGFSFRNLLFAGIIIGALGAVMDVSMSVASAMEEVRAADPAISRSRLIGSGMNVGGDIMGTMTNTLILAYTGASIPLLLLFMAYQPSFVKIINMDFIATEFVRALSGSIGLVFAIPITALASGALLRRRSSVRDAGMEESGS